MKRIASDLNKTVQTNTQVWPSGLRRHVQVVVSPEAWVRIPPLAHFSIPTWLFIFDSMIVFYLLTFKWPKMTFPNVKMQRVNSEFLYRRWILVVNEPSKLILYPKLGQIVSVKVKLEHLVLPERPYETTITIFVSDGLGQHDEWVRTCWKILPTTVPVHCKSPPDAMWTVHFISSSIPSFRAPENVWAILYS